MAVAAGTAALAEVVARAGLAEIAAVTPWVTVQTAHCILRVVMSAR